MDEIPPFARLVGHRRIPRVGTDAQAYEFLHDYADETEQSVFEAGLHVGLDSDSEFLTYAVVLAVTEADASSGYVRRQLAVGEESVRFGSEHGGIAVGGLHVDVDPVADANLSTVAQGEVIGRPAGCDRADRCESQCLQDAPLNEHGVVREALFVSGVGRDPLEDVVEGEG